jgi:hypothetical protein
VMGVAPFLNFIRRNSNEQLERWSRNSSSMRSSTCPCTLLDMLQMKDQRTLGIIPNSNRCIMSVGVANVTPRGL